MFLEAQLDDPVQPIIIPTPRYPPVLRARASRAPSTCSTSWTRTGHAEPASFKVLKTTNPAFVEPAKEAILKGVFKPAKFKGQTVRAAGAAARSSFKVGQ